MDYDEQEQGATEARFRREAEARRAAEQKERDRLTAERLKQERDVAVEEAREKLDSMTRQDS